LRDIPPPPRIGPGDLARLGCFLYGRRWQTALARAIPVDPRLVRRWFKGDRPVSPRCALIVVELACERHRGRIAALEARYQAMAASLAGAAVRGRLCGTAEKARLLPLLVAAAGAVLVLGIQC
jgi:hypothetical protein